MVFARPSIPTIRIAAPRALPVRAPKRRSSKRRGVGSGGGLSPINAFIGAAVFGMAEKSGLIDKLPSVPLVGRLGTVAIGAHFYSKHGGGKIARDVAFIAAILAGHQLGHDGSIAGEDE